MAIVPTSPCYPYCGGADPDNVTVVAFAQRVSDRVVLQAGSNLAAVPAATVAGGSR